VRGKRAGNLAIEREIIKLYGDMDESVVTPSRPFHLIALLGTLLCSALLLLSFNLYADARIQQYVHTIAPLGLAQSNVGLAWQQSALQSPDLLLVYGSSELDHQAYEGDFHASHFFAAYPSGFTIFPIGSVGNTCLVMAQNIAALGTQVDGKKLVISLSPPWFIRSGAEQIRQDQYAGNFSRLHAYAFVFASDLSWALKQQIAARMLTYPATYAQDPLLALGLRLLAENSIASRGLYALTVPLGQANLFVMLEQDRFETVRAVWEHPAWNSAAPRQPSVIQWDTVLQQASEDAVENAGNNPYGIYTPLWTARGGRFMAPNARRTDKEFIKTVRKAPDWQDCDLLLRAVVELHAKPLVLSQPMKGAYFKAIGVSYNARREFYLEQRQLLERYHVPFVDFADRDDDLFFVVDPFSHLSAKGWAYYDQVLDAFYHDRLSLQP
jgi:D-alanine transfer protein